MLIFSKKHKDSQHWLTVSDLMSGLMILFIFISVGFMRSSILERDRANEELKKFKAIEAHYTDILERLDRLEKEKQDAQEQLENLRTDYEELVVSEQVVKDNLDKVKHDLDKVNSIAETYQQNQEAIYNALTLAFPEDLLSDKYLNAEIDKNTLTFVFKSSDALFGNASANLKEDYRKALAIFFPKYINAILPYKESISEIRIEGHTSSEWGYYPNEIRASETARKLYSYFENMKLSQARTNSVLHYVLNDLQHLVPQEEQQWLRVNMAAVGLSSSKPILNLQGIEDSERSRRVTFRIITNADSQIQQILQKE